ncbi:MAG: hypothetical protein LPK11_03825 [Chromatiaceae bacterium]|nr:hypothetical protein [Chromatiaceae bacterium]
MRKLLLTLCCIALPLAATPLTLQLKRDGEQLQFYYQFQVNNAPQQLHFSLDSQSINNHFRQFRALKPALIQQYLWRDARAHVAQYPGARLQRLPGSESLRYRLKAPAELSDKLETELSQLLQKQQQHYLEQHYYYAITLPLGEQVIIPDHLRLMQDSLSALLPVANALHQKLMNVPSRQSVGYIGNWLQQIPYQDLSDRANSAGSSFNPPLKLLQENQGDCDSKAVLLAALVRMLLPDVKLAMIYLPQHAMLALQLPVQSSDDAVTIDGRDYLLLDPTGPALLPPGEISPQYRIYTQNGQFAYRSL